MTFQATVTSDMAQMLNASHFGESVDYWPACGAGSKRTITVIVDEMDAGEELADNGIVKVWRINVFARNNATTGIDNPQEGDRLVRAVDTPPAAGVKLNEYRLRRVLDRDADGVWCEFVCRRRKETGRNVPQQESFAR